ncbi:MAG: T9SS type A sorting domain-containing protein [Pedobacter sp.]|nr:T9SS type A sorting domain-containing protein [Chitinophagaceae bacterium]
MFRYYISICLFISLSCNSYCQWQWLNPKPSGLANNKVVFTDGQNGFIINDNGDLSKTNNQGASWQKVQNFSGGTAMAMFDSLGIISGNNGILYLSSDNGINWQQIYTGIKDNFLTINIISRDTFYLSNKNPTATNTNIYKTTDKGKTFQTLNFSGVINSLFFVNNYIGYLVNNTSIQKTVDGGLSWQIKYNSGSGSSTAIQFLNKVTGFISRGGNLLRTMDGGNTWVSSTISSESMNSVCFINSRLGYLAGEYGAMYRTIDGGQTFSIAGFSAFTDGKAINSLAFISSTSGFAVGLQGRILKTIDSAKNWIPYSPTHTPVTATSFANAPVAYATTWGNIYKSTDKNYTWGELSLTTDPSNSRFEQIHFSSTDTGFVSTANPVTIKKTNDGGATWRNIAATPYSFNNVNGSYFITPKIGYLSLYTTSNAQIIKTLDGGDSWTSVWYANNTNKYYSKIFYNDESIGYGISYYQLSKTKDSSKTWNVVFTQPDISELTSVWFVNKQKGFVSDSQGNIYTTNDSAKTWRTLRYILGGKDYRINTMKFFNDKIGYATSDNQFGPLPFGNIYKTIDGGDSWQLSKNVGGNSIEFTADSTVIVSGFAGEILASPIKEIKIDSLQNTLNNSCNNIFTAVVTACLGRVDNINFEITDSKGTKQLIPANFSFVENERKLCSAIVNNLIADSSYSVSVYYYADGHYMYSDKINFIAKNLVTKPIITQSGNRLSSNYFSGNQWFRNDTLIINATSSSYTIPSTSTYRQCFKVKQTNSYGCYSYSDNLCFFSTILPLKLLSFRAIYSSNKVSAFWQTTNEYNSKSFDIERSVDGLNFKSIGIIIAKGNFNSLQNYDFVDNTVQQLNANIIYYRLLITDKDGSSSYSNIIAVQTLNINQSLIVSPNPATNFINLSFSHDIQNPIITIFDSEGRRIFAYSHIGNLTNYRMQIDKLISGIYNINVKNDLFNLNTRLIIVKLIR